MVQGPEAQTEERARRIQFLKRMADTIAYHSTSFDPSATDDARTRILNAIENDLKTFKAHSKEFPQEYEQQLERVKAAAERMALVKGPDGSAVLNLIRKITEESPEAPEA